MKKTLWDLIKLILPLSAEKKHLLASAKEYLEPADYKDIAYYLRMDKLFGYIKDYGTAPETLPSMQWAEFKSHITEEHITELIAKVNPQIKQGVDASAFTQFSTQAAQRIPELIANNIIGHEEEKFAGALILFAKDPIHILYLGDPGTGKTDILRSIAALAPKGSFGLGSGTSSVGLTATFKGKDLIKGLLPQADGGVACIDELNLLKTVDLAGLYSAMEKGFVTYDKGGKHETIAADVRVAATANPKGDEFVGQGAAVLKKQIPFGAALLSRFHLVFMIRKPDAHELGNIARTIVKGKAQMKKGDVAFVQAYCAWALAREVAFPKKFEPMIVNFIEDMHADTKKFLVEIGPRTIIGTIRMAQAYARMQGKETVEEYDLLRIFTLIKDTYYVRKKE